MAKKSKKVKKQKLSGFKLAETQYTRKREPRPRGSGPATSA